MCLNGLPAAIIGKLAVDGIADQVRAILEAEKTHGHLVDAERAAEEARLAQERAAEEERLAGVRAQEVERLRVERAAQEAAEAAAAAALQEQISAIAALSEQYGVSMEEEEEVDELVTEATDPDTGEQDDTSEDPGQGERVHGTPPPKRQTRSTSGKNMARRGTRGGMSTSPGSMRVEIPVRRSGSGSSSPPFIYSRGGKRLILEPGAVEKIPPCTNCSGRLVDDIQVKCFVEEGLAACKFCSQARMRCSFSKFPLLSPQRQADWAMGAGGGSRVAKTAVGAKRARSGASSAGGVSKRARAPKKSAQNLLVDYLAQRGTTKGKRTSQADAQLLSQLAPEALMQDAGKRLEENTGNDIAALRAALKDQYEATERVRVAAERALDDMEGVRLYFASARAGAALTEGVGSTGTEASEGDAMEGQWESEEGAGGN
jgi:hypothetical protein